MAINVGDVRRLTALFESAITDPAVPADPDVVTFTYYFRDPDDRVTKVYETGPDVKRISEGSYYLDVPLTTDGYFGYDVQGEGTIDAYEKSGFIIET